MKAPVFSKRLVFACLLSLALLATAACAQPDQRRAGPDRERIRSVIIGKFVMEMDLNQKQSEQFFPRLRQFMDGMEGIQHEDREAREQLKRLSQTPDADHGQLNEILEKRRSADRQIGEMKQQFLTDISGFLSPQQVSRCSVLMDEIPQRVREMIRDKERARGKEMRDYPQGDQRKDQPGKKGY